MYEFCEWQYSNRRKMAEKTLESTTFVSISIVLVNFCCLITDWYRFCCIHLFWIRVLFIRQNIFSMFLHKIVYGFTKIKFEFPLCAHLGTIFIYTNSGMNATILSKSTCALCDFCVDCATFWMWKLFNRFIVCWIVLIYRIKYENLIVFDSLEKFLFVFIRNSDKLSLNFESFWNFLPTNPYRTFFFIATTTKWR